MSEEGVGKHRGVSVAAGEQPSASPYNYYYGTFQGVANYQPQPQLPSPSQPVMGFPHPVPPPAFPGQHQHYYHQGYQTVPGYVVSEVRPFREERLPCCGLGLGWFLFITGFIFGAIPWYIGAFLLLCVRLDYREKPGLIACTLGVCMVLLGAVTLGVTKSTRIW